MNVSVHHCHTHGHGTSRSTHHLMKLTIQAGTMVRVAGGGSHAGLCRSMQDVADYKAGLHAFSVDTPGRLGWRRCYATFPTPGT
jgi:hypothetical protein